MALLQTHSGQRAETYQDLARLVLFVAAAVVAMLVLTAIFGVQQPAPSLEIVPDPAGLLPF